MRTGVRNLTDEVYMVEGQEFASVGNILTTCYGWHRDWYMPVHYSI